MSLITFLLRQVFDKLRCAQEVDRDRWNLGEFGVSLEHGDFDVEWHSDVLLLFCP